MLVTGSDYWGQSQPGGVPASHVCIVDQTAKNAAGQVVPAYYLRRLTDEVTVATAGFNGTSNGTLSVTATSSDPTAVLTLAGYGPATTTPGTSAGIGAGTGLELVGNAATVTGLQAPTNVVQVVSTKGGTGRRDTDTSTGTTTLLGVPTAFADSGTVAEDCGAAACAAGQGVTVDLLANDTILLNGQSTTLRNVVASGLGTVTVAVQQGRLGTATVSADGILSYTPNANANGTDSVIYTATVNGVASNQSQATINITPVNDAPVAGNTASGGVVGKQNIMNLVANSTDADGNGDVRDAVVLTWPTQLGGRPTPVNGVISYTPAASGAFSFTYQVTDVAGALSANTATGTVTVSPGEIITFGKHQFVQNKNRWTIDGTDNIVQGQTITIVYENGLLKGAALPCNGTATNPTCVIGTSPVDGLGNWGLDKVGVSGALNPKAGASIWASPPTHIRAFSTLPSLGGTAAIDIVFK
nr:Ig-like domain-containing protein [Ramlibacter alkalitolerans]